MENDKTPEAEKMSLEEIVKHLNVPPRDETKYPERSKEEIQKAGSFLWKLNLLASSVDGNLTSLLWKLYIDLDRFLTSELSDENIDQDLTTLASTLVVLKSYLLSSGNPLFNADLQKQETKEPDIIT